MGILRRNRKLIRDRKEQNKGYSFLTKWLEDDKINIDWEIVEVHQKLCWV